MPLVPPFHYQVSWQPRNWRPGEHRAAVSGDGGSFRGERLLADASQARFLSVRASIRDPFRRMWVKENQQRATLDVILVIDVSRSMRVQGEGSCCRAVGDLLASAALSAYRGGDRIGVICASGRIDRKLSAATSRRLPPVFAIAERIRALPEEKRKQPGLDSVDAMLDVWRRLPTRRSLVLVVSDYHAPTETWMKILETLRHHEVVPVVMQDRSPVPILPKWGLVHLDDAESGRSRTLLMRPSLQRRLTAGIEQRQAELDSMFEGLRLRPCWLRRPFDPMQLTGYFHSVGMRKGGSETTPASAWTDPTPGDANGVEGTRGNRSLRAPPGR